MDNNTYSEQSSEGTVGSGHPAPRFIWPNIFFFFFFNFTTETDLCCAPKQQNVKLPARHQCIYMNHVYTGDGRFTFPPHGVAIDPLAAAATRCSPGRCGPLLLFLAGPAQLALHGAARHGTHPPIFSTPPHGANVVVAELHDKRPCCSVVLKQQHQ